MFHSTITTKMIFLATADKAKINKHFQSIIATFSLDKPSDGSSFSPSKHVSFRILRLVTFCYFVFYFRCTFFLSSTFFFSFVRFFFTLYPLSYHVFLFSFCYVVLFFVLSFNHPPMKLREGNVFNCVCLSVWSRVRVNPF